MANLIHHDPFNDLSRFNPFGEDFLKDFSWRPVLRRLEEGEPTMRLDVTEDDQAYTVKAEIPGVGKEDIDVRIEGNQVSIEAEVKKEAEQKEGAKVIRRERYYGRVARAFTLAQAVDEGKAEARYEQGVLVLTLPKKAGEQAKKVAVS
jgi:HSP20 family protein